MRLSRVLEVGGLQAYSAVNFLRAVGPEGRVYTVDVNPVPAVADNHRTLMKDCAMVTSDDLDRQPLDLVFFDCHVYGAQMAMLFRLRDERLVTDATVLALHDTGLHAGKYVPWAYEIRGGWVHQPVERRMVNDLRSLGYNAVSFHMAPAKASPAVPVRHGLTIMQKVEHLDT